MTDSRECLDCAAREREIRRQRIQNREDLTLLNEAQSDNRALRRAVHRLSTRLDEARDLISDLQAELNSRDST